MLEKKNFTERKLKLHWPESNIVEYQSEVFDWYLAF